MPARAQDANRIGAIFELSGRFVPYGTACKRGLDYAAANFGGTVAGRTYEFVYRDVQSDARATVSAFTELSDTDHLNTIIGPIASPIVAAAIPSWRVSKPVWLVPGSSATGLEKEAGQEPNFFHTYPYTYQYYTTITGALKLALGDNKTVAVLYSDDDYGTSHLPAVEKYFGLIGYKIVAKEAVRTNSPDMTPVLTRIKRAHPDILLAVVQTTDAVTVAKQVRTLRMDIPYLITTGAAKYREWQDAVGEAQQGWMSPATYLPNTENWPADKDHPKLFPDTKTWEAGFVARYNRPPDDNDVLCYNSAAMLLLAIDKAGGDNDKARVSAALKSLNVMTPMGTGQFLSSEGTINQAFSNMLLIQRQDGKSVILYPAAAANAKMIKAN